MNRPPIRIDDGLYLDPDEIKERFIRAGGPGGQNVNKVSSAVQLRFDARHSSALSNVVFLRLKKLAGSRMTTNGVIVITARRFRTRERNREDALDRLQELIRKAAVAPTKRRKTGPSRAARQKRMTDKRRRAGIKSGRGAVNDGD